MDHRRTPRKPVGNHRPRPSVSGIVALAAGLLTAGRLASMTAPDNALAQAGYPTRPVTVLVGFPAGTAPDALARLLADRLAERLAQPVVVENVTGAAGNLAAGRLVQAEPDGHTLLLAGNATMVINQNLYENLPFDPVTDLLPISQVAMTPNVLVVHPDIPAATVQELAAYARARPDELSYAHAGLGTSTHLAGELFNQAAGTSVAGVPYGGGNAIYPDMLTGSVDMCFCNIVTALPLVREGKLRALAVTSLDTIPSAPDLPTMDQSGFPGFHATAWFGLVAPAGTPASVIDRLHRETAEALADEGLRSRLDDLAMVTIGNSPAEFADVIEAEIPYWEEVIEALDLKLQ